MSRIPGFISYSSADKQRAAEVRTALAACGVDGFMAHDDIYVSQQWRDRILDELRRMQVFVPLLSANFKTSEWTAQEAGAAIVRADVLIIPVSLDGTVPYGFLNHFQGRPLPRPIDPAFFRDVLLMNRPHAVIEVLIDELEGAGSFRGAEALMQPLAPFFDTLTPAQAERIIDISTNNGQIWDASKCRGTYLPVLLQASKGKVPPDKLQELHDLIA